MRNIIALKPCLVVASLAFAPLSSFHICKIRTKSKFHSLQYLYLVLADVKISFQTIYTRKYSPSYLRIWRKIYDLPNGYELITQNKKTNPNPSNTLMANLDIGLLPFSSQKRVMKVLSRLRYYLQIV